VDGGERASVLGEEGGVVDVQGALAMCGTVKGGVAGGSRPSVSETPLGSSVERGRLIKVHLGLL
jgi:hypothetical protein